MPPLGSKKTYYAWSNFKKTGDHPAIKCGDEVSQEKLKADDEQWKEWVKTGTVRTAKYPDIPDTVAPTDHYKKLAAEAAEGDFTAEVETDEG